jgi:hypothetical protein
MQDKVVLTFLKLHGVKTCGGVTVSELSSSSE